MKRLTQTACITECSEWFSWFAWYPITCTSSHGVYRVWWESVEYRYILVDGIFRFEYRLSLPVHTQPQTVTITPRSRRRHA